MATNSSYSQKVLKCSGRACAKCGYCRDWYWNPVGKTKSYKKRLDGTCTSSYSYGISGYGPGCGGCGLCCLAQIPFVNLCVHQYYGGAGYGHGGGIPLNGFLHGGISNNIDTLAGIDIDARRRRRENAGLADIALGGVARFAVSMANDVQKLSSDRLAVARAHHDDDRLCECSDNQQ